MGEEGSITADSFLSGLCVPTRSTTGSIFMEDVFCPTGNMLAVEGLKGPFSCLNNARFGISFGAIGALEESIRLARDYALERHQFKKPLAAFQLVQQKLANVSRPPPPLLSPRAWRR